MDQHGLGDELITVAEHTLLFLSEHRGSVRTGKWYVCGGDNKWANGARREGLLLVVLCLFNIIVGGKWFLISVFFHYTAVGIVGEHA